MSNDASKASIRSPSYPSMPLGQAIEAVRKIESRYRTAPIDRTDAAKLIGYSSLSGPASKALAALASYGLVERAGKGEMRVSERARAILHAESDEEQIINLRAAALEPQLFREISERFSGVVPPEEGIVTFLNRREFNPSAVRPAAKAYLETASFMNQHRAAESNRSPASKLEYSEAPLAEKGERTTNPQSKMENFTSNPPGESAPDFGMMTTTDLRFKIGKSRVVQVRSNDELDATDIDKLIKLLEAQRDALIE